MKMKTSNIVIIAVVVVLYTFLLGFFGCFGETVSSVFHFFVNKILPYICIVLGYFLSIFVPIRVFQAISANKERKEEFIKDQKLQEYSDRQKSDAEQLRKLLGNEDRV